MNRLKALLASLLALEPVLRQKIADLTAANTLLAEANATLQAKVDAYEGPEMLATLAQLEAANDALQSLTAL
jgi:hypothetical protein